MGSVGAKRTGSMLNNRPPVEETVTDDYGRTYRVITKERVPEDYKLWTSGTWRGVGDDYDKGYAVFAPIFDDKVDTSKGVVVRISGEDADAIRDSLGYETSEKAEKYVRRYDKPGAKGYVKRKVARLKRGAEAMRRLGI